MATHFIVKRARAEFLFSLLANFWTFHYAFASDLAPKYPVVSNKPSSHDPLWGRGAGIRNVRKVVMCVKEGIS